MEQDCITECLVGIQDLQTKMNALVGTNGNNGRIGTIETAGKI